MAASWALPMCANGLAGAGFARALARACTAVVAALAEEVLGTGHLWGNKFHSFCHAFSSCLGDVDAVATVMFGSVPKVPAVFAVGGPSGAFVRAFVDQDFGAWWGKRCLVEIKGAVELGFGG